MTGDMVVFKVSSQDADTTCYTKTYSDAEAVAGVMTGNGFRPTIRRIRRKDIPMRDIRIINAL